MNKPGYKKYWLILLAPIVAELLSGSTPFTTFIKLPILLTYAGFYGCGALIIREIVAHKKMSYINILLWGAAFGVLEEGILLKSWYDPTWMGAAITSQAIRFSGVSVLQPFANIVYHAIISITVPILLIESFSGERKPWLSKKGLVLSSLFFVAAASVMGLTFNQNYQVSAKHYLFSILILIVFIVAANIRFSVPDGGINRPGGRLWLIGSLFIPLQFFVFYGLAPRNVSWIVILSLAILLYTIYAIIYWRTDWKKQARKLVFASAAGFITGLLPAVAIASRQESAKTINLIIGMVVVLVLIVLYRRTMLQPDN
ncbi:MAG: hypothetical protein KAU23_02800 [Anaerolineales bacterium]|nr:hypothetical protein [Anaerolineales bacterium]